MLNVSINYSGAQKTEYSGRIATTMAADALGPSHQGISRHSIMQVTQVLGNYTKYIVMFPKINSTCEGLVNHGGWGTIMIVSTKYEVIITSGSFRNVEEQQLLN